MYMYCMCTSPFPAHTHIHTHTLHVSRSLRSVWKVMMQSSVSRPVMLPLLYSLRDTGYTSAVTSLSKHCGQSHTLTLLYVNSHLHFMYTTFFKLCSNSVSLSHTPSPSLPYFPSVCYTFPLPLPPSLPPSLSLCLLPFSPPSLSLSPSLPPSHPVPFSRYTYIHVHVHVGVVSWRSCSVDSSRCVLVSQTGLTSEGPAQSPPRYSCWTHSRR